MNSPLLGASDFDVDALDAFLISDRAPEDCMQLSDLDGFLTGIAIGPELIMPSEWLPVIWGSGEPEFESRRKRSGFLNAIMGRYNEILHLLQHAPGRIRADFLDDQRRKGRRCRLGGRVHGGGRASAGGMAGVAGFGRRQATAGADRRPPARSMRSSKAVGFFAAVVF